RRRNADLHGEPIDEREVEVDEVVPGPLNDVPQPRQNGVDERCTRIRLDDGRQMFAPPILAVIDLNAENRLSRTAAVKNRHGEPNRALRTLHPVAIAPAVLVELHVVVMHEHVGFLQQIEISEPRQIARLQDHERRHEKPLRLRIDLLRSPAPAGEIMPPYSCVSPTGPQWWG